MKSWHNILASSLLYRKITIPFLFARYIATLRTKWKAQTSDKATRLIQAMMCHFLSSAASGSPLQSTCSKVRAECNAYSTSSLWWLREYFYVQ